MLTRLTHNRSTDRAAIAIGEADFPAPFAHGLEYNAPVHGNWNIVHTGMLVPESHQIYICAQNCMRGVAMTAAEMNAADRFSMVVLEEHDLYDGDLFEITCEGIADAIRKLPAPPRAVLVFPVCLHHFMGTDMAAIYRELESRFPGIDFIRCWMDPIMQKTGLTPEQKQRKALYDPLEALLPDPRAVNLLGGNLAVDPEGSDIARLLAKNHFVLRELPTCETYGDFLAMGESALELCTTPFGDYGARQLARRLQRPYLWLPCSWQFDQIAADRKRLCEALGIADAVIAADRAAALAALRRLAATLGGTPVAIDAMAVFEPLGLARLLLEHGVNVVRVYLDVVAADERSAFDWLRAHAPGLPLVATIRPEMRIVRRGGDRPAGKKLLAVGPKAAYFEDTEHFVNTIDNGGFWGYAGIAALARQMGEALAAPKDTRALVPRKGWGCDCVL